LLLSIPICAGQGGHRVFPWSQNGLTNRDVPWAQFHRIGIVINLRHDGLGQGNGALFRR
jgi:hypothetical protein